MAYNIPGPIVQFGNPPAILQSLAFNVPKEGRLYIPLEFDWSLAQGGSLQVNLQGVATQTFSQIVMLDVDNSQCGVPVTFYFADSQTTLIVPAESGGLFPVFTGQTMFYASAPGALASDVTRVRVLNYRQEPVALPPPEFNQTDSAFNVAAGTTAVVPASVSGTLTSYTVNFGGQMGTGGGGSAAIQLKDHATGNVIDQTIVDVGTAGYFNGIVLTASDIAVRFGGGIDIVVTNGGTGWASEGINVTVRYRSP